MDCYGKRKLVTAILFAGFVCSMLFHYFTGPFAGRGYPYSTFLFDPMDRFNDFFNIYRATVDLNPFSAPVSVYFPFTYLPVYLLTFITPPVAYAVFAGGFLAFLLIAEYRCIPAQGVADRVLTMVALTAISYPVLFLLDRGNLECMVFVCIGMFIHCHRNGKDDAAALFLAGAVAMKLYPAVFGVLFLADRKWKPLMLTAAASLGLTVAGAALLDGGIAASIDGLRNNLLLFKSTYLNTVHGLQHNSSIYVPTVIVASKLSAIRSYSAIYPYLAILLFLAAAAYTAYREKVYWKRVAILSFMMILLPQISYDYKLIHLFLPLLLFLGSADRSRLDPAYAAIFGLLLIPKDYYYLFADVSINGSLNALLMSTLIVMAVADGRGEPSV